MHELRLGTVRCCGASCVGGEAKGLPGNGCGAVAPAMAVARLEILEIPRIGMQHKQALSIATKKDTAGARMHCTPAHTSTPPAHPHIHMRAAEQAAHCQHVCVRELVASGGDARLRTA
eukprot:81652-Chlamydomonas_euryale.AAC.2